MSLGYAEKLSYIEDVGSVGMAEFFDPSSVLQEKIEQLAKLIQESKHLVVFTGAGISTSCGIPDFRGPKGIWTLQREGKALPEASLPFHRAMASITHMALVELEKAGILKFVISQNVDGLHLRSGIPRDKLSELHGNSFMECCPSCGVEYLRDFEVETIGLKETSRRCSDLRCGAKLKDTVLDWEDALPDKEMLPAEKHCRIADVVLCLGTSLQITPACNLPLKCLRGGGKIVIVNLQVLLTLLVGLLSFADNEWLIGPTLQKTPKDKKACLVIHGLVDKVITGVVAALRMRIPPFVRIDEFQIILTHASSADKKFINWTMRIASVHGVKAQLPFIKSIEVSFSDARKYKAAVLDQQPFNLKRRTLTGESFEILLKINLSDGCGCLSTEINIPFCLNKCSTDCLDLEKDAIIQNMKGKAIQDSCCGQTTVVERRSISEPKQEVAVYGIVTNIKTFSSESLSNGDVKLVRECATMNGTGAVTKPRSSNSRKRKSRVQ